MFTHYRTQGVILKKIDRGEADQLLVVYTKEFGRLEIVAKSIRKITSKLRSATENISIIEIEFIQGKACKTLTDAVIINRLGGIRHNFKKKAIAGQVLCLAEKAVKDQQCDLRIWELILSVLIFIDSASNGDNEALYHYFAWHLMELSGWRPQWQARSVGNENLTLLSFFLESDIIKSARMKLTRRQKEILTELADNYLEFVTK